MHRSNGQSGKNGVKVKRPTKPDDQHWDAKVHSRGSEWIDDDFGDGGRAH